MSFEKIDWSKCLYHVYLTYDQTCLLYNALRFYHGSQLRLSEFFSDGKYPHCDEVMELVELVRDAIFVTEPKKHHLDFNFDQYSLIDIVLRHYGAHCFRVGADVLELDEIELKKVDELIDIIFHCSFTPPSCAIDDDDQTTI